MFLDEARIAARMNHPNIVQIFDFGEVNERPYLTMALVEGVSLSSLLKVCQEKGTQVPAPVGRLIALGLCEALEYAHNLRGPAGEDFGTVHRDVNPSNVLLSQSGAVLLTDFGIAKAQGNIHHTRTGQVMGKFAYMAPEQIASGITDRRADIYATALTLYEMLTLVSPFKRSSEPATIDAVRSASLPDPLQLRPDLSLAMAGALVQGLSRDVEQRFKTARALAEALMDGPIARPQELGDYVQAYCPRQLSVFQSVAKGPSGKSPLAVSTTRELIRPLASGAKAGELLGHSWKRYGYGVLLTMAILLTAASIWSVARGLPFWRSRVSAPPPVTVKETLPAAAVPAMPVNDPVMATALAPQTESESEKGTAPLAPIAKAQRPEPIARKTGGIGYLSADATPWAVLSIDNREVDETPISRFPIAAGRHLLMFRNPESGKKVERSVRVQQGKILTIRINLTE
jgi:eukaryotic-like serine/threonine-protein kinase